MVQWLRLRASNAGGAGLIPGQGIKIPHAVRCGQKIFKNHFGKFKKKKEYYHIPEYLGAELDTYIF